ncbi:Ca2+ regulator and membrane fusion protein Fig1-domain-containing protein [Lipomyces oligophaga]|uniref:Ca2+ regulator and membrane fusion protein Fig1-domain-containing protein n=1 Tax=Lipomyces oligophaga TaxID=45792 RepID=UPI0034CF267A
MAHKFQVEFRGVSFIRPRHVFLLLLIASIVFNSLLLAGCSAQSSNVLKNIYLLRIGYNDGVVYSSSDASIVNSDISLALASLVGDSSMQIRIGYFGICMTESTSSSSSWTCSSNATYLAELLTSDEDSLNLMHLASSFRHAIVFPYLLIVATALAFIVFVAILPYPPFLRGLAVAATFLSALFVLVSVLWQHTASIAGSSAAVSLANGTVYAGIGKIAIIFGWLSFGCLVVTVIGVYYFVAASRFVSEVDV